MFGTEGTDIRRMLPTEMRMLQMMCVKTLLDEIASRVVTEWVDVENIDEQLRPHQLR